jgi:hypothetical protein
MTFIPGWQRPRTDGTVEHEHTIELRVPENPPVLARMAQKVGEVASGGESTQRIRNA